MSTQAMLERIEAEWPRLRAVLDAAPAKFSDPAMRRAEGPIAAELERLGNRSADWRSVLVSERTDLSRIRDCDFEGICRIDLPATKTRSGTETGLRRARFADCAIVGACAIHDVTFARHTLFDDAEVLRCGMIDAGRQQLFGLGQRIAFAPSGGRRAVPSIPFAHFSDLAAFALLPLDAPEAKRVWDWVQARLGEPRAQMSIVRGAVANCGTLFNVFLEPHVFVDGCASLSHVCAFADADRRTVLRHSGPIEHVLLHEGCEIDGAARCDRTWMAEGSWVRDGARCSSAVIGPNSGVGSGELRTSLIGPWVGFSHEALCIATYWPGGKGNISYGANVGSNHSGKASDQEHFAGEGVFYGLDCAIKFPFNSMDAPHSLIASGVVCLPQKLQFPFSLIAEPIHVAPELPRGFNELFPGWQLTRNLYGLLRNQEKYAERDRARREKLESRVFHRGWRPLLEQSIARLERAESLAPAGILPDGQPFFLDSQIAGIGKNFVREDTRRQAIADYRWGLQLIEFFDPETPLEPAERSERRHRIAALLRDNRARDDRRGQSIIPDYADKHGTPDDDPLIRAWAP